MKAVSILLVFIHFININESSVTVIEGCYPCLDDFIYMEREIGRPPAVENYWDGSIKLSDFTNLTNNNIILQLTEFATVTVNTTNASVRTNDSRTFIFDVFGYTRYLNFTVLGGQGKPYPNIVNVSLNGKAVCEYPAIVGPTMVRPKPMASSVKNFVPDCGRRKIEQNTLIIQGNNTKPGEWPWHVAIYLISGNNETTLKYQCDGTIINTDAVITAAQCVVNNNDETFPSQKLRVVAGKYHMNTKDRWIQQRDVASTKIHRAFSRSTLKNDIAILRVKEHFSFDDYLQPICLWTDSVISLNGTIVGWGVNEHDVASETLMSSNLKITFYEECLTRKPKFLNFKSICAKIENDRSLCNGNSGGGLVIPVRQVDNEYSYFLRGIISVGVSSENERICYKVLTDASKFIEWIIINSQ